MINRSGDKTDHLELSRVRAAFDDETMEVSKSWFEEYMKLMKNT